jgi:hypothetical protein
MKNLLAQWRNLAEEQQTDVTGENFDVESGPFPGINFGLMYYT